MDPSRRHLVIGGAAAALLAAAWPVARQLGSYPALTWRPEVLSPKQAAVYAVIGDFIAPPGPPLPGAGGDRVTLERLDAWLAGVPATKATLIAALPLAFEHGTALDRYGALRLTHLPAPAREEALVAWAESRDPVRAQLWTVIKVLFGFAYFDRPDVLRAARLTVPCG